MLPTAFICKNDDHGKPTYVCAAAINDTIHSYFPDFNTESPHGKLLNLCHDLSISEIESYLFRNRKRKKGESLLALFANNAIKYRIQAYIDNRMEQILDIIKDNQFYLCHKLERKIHFNDVHINFLHKNALPKLKFVKTQVGIKYSLTLDIGDKNIVPAHFKPIIVTQNPGYIIVNRNVIRVEDIDTAKLKPFIKNEDIFIPNSSIKTYFDKFVSEILNKVEIEVENFEAIKENTLKKAEIFFVYPFNLKKWCIDIRFIYDHFTFKLSETIQKRHKIVISDTNEITVHQCDRNIADEAKMVDVLKDLGFQLLDGRLMCYGDNPFSTIAKITELHSVIKEHFDVHEPEIDNKTIALSSIVEVASFELVNDWFDLHGNIQIGDASFPISRLFRNIRNDNRYFLLDNGKYAIIPEEILTKYSQIVKYAVEDGKKWKLSKVHSPLIEENEIAPQSQKTIVDDVEYIPNDKLKASLRPYQIEGVKWLIKHRKNGLGACLADDMGLGKTLQTIAALVDAKENLSTNDVVSKATNNFVQLDLFGETVEVGRNALNAFIVLPASLVFNWYKELKKFAPSLHIINYTGAARKNKQVSLMSFDVILTTYQTLVSELKYFKAQHFHYVILDESQQIRNNNSKSFQAVHALSCDHRISLSGTPIENSLKDLWAQMEFINPAILGNFSFFKSNFLIPIEKENNEFAIAELKKLIAPYILRRTKEEVAKDLPELSESISWVEMQEKQAKLYEKEKSAARNYLAGLDRNDNNYRFNVLATIMKLRQIANHPSIVYSDYDGGSGKFDEVTEQIKTIAKSGHKLLVFSSFLSHLDYIESYLESTNITYVKLTGQNNADAKERAVVQFQNEKHISVFLISIKAGGTGLNLTAADYIFIIDPWWNPFVEKQAIARAHRIGQTNNVHVTRFITRDTIEERIMHLQAKKRKLSDDIIEVDKLSTWSDSDLEDLIG